MSERATPDHGSPLLRAVVDGLAGVAPGEHLLVAVSGGPDSTALLLALHALAPARGFSVTVAHVDHGVRGPDATAERDAVAGLAATLAMPFVERRLALAPEAGLEARARRARLRALTAMATACGASRILLAHTADDQAETVLLRLVRGAGRGGLAGMRRVRGRFLRPLLGATRADVRRFLADRGVGFALDRSNADVRHARNRMRRLVLPVLTTEFNPRLTRHLAALADRLRDEDDLLEALAAARAPALLDGDGMLAVVGDEPPALGRRIVRRWLEAGRRKGVAAQHVERALALARGSLAGVVALPGAWRVLREGDRLVRRAGRGPTPRAFAMPIAPGASVCDAAGAWRMTLSAPEPAGAPLPRDPSEAVFDAAQLGALRLRSRRPGDRIHLPGVGTRKLQDVLVDARVPREARDGLPLLESGCEILWVPGVARGSGAAIGPQTRLVVRGLLERPGTPPGPESGGRALPMQNSHGT